MKKTKVMYRIGDLRENLNLSQQDLATNIKASVSTIHRWETSKSFISPAYIRLLGEYAESLGIDLEDYQTERKMKGRVALRDVGNNKRMEKTKKERKLRGQGMPPSSAKAKRKIRWNHAEYNKMIRR